MSGTVRRVLPALVVAVVLGILGMHAIGGTHATASGASHAAMTGHGADVAPPAADAAASHPGLGDVLGGEASDVHVMMLCGAMLLTAGAVLLLLGRRRPPRPWARLAARVGGLATRPGIVTAKPPAVWEFSVIRC